MSLFGGSSTSGSLPYETTDTCDKLKAFGIVCRQLPNPMPFVGTADCANFTSLKVRTPCTPLQPTLSDPVYPPSQPGSQPYVPAPSSGNGAISDEAGQGIGGISTTMWIIIIIAIVVLLTIVFGKKDEPVRMQPGATYYGAPPVYYQRN